MKLAVWKAKTGAPASRARRSQVGEQGAGDAVAARGRMDGERAPAGPARGQPTPWTEASG